MDDVSAFMRPLSWLRRGTGLALDALWPPRCALCQKSVGDAGQLCPSCWGQFAFISDPACASCGLPFAFDTGPDTLCGECLADPPPFDHARAALRYNDSSRNLILGFKHGDHTLLTRLFAPWLMLAGKSFIMEADIIVPVPLHRWRLLRRRYNQAALLASALARLSRKPFDPLVLQRRRFTRSQGGLGRSARERNVQGAFYISPEKIRHIKGKSILLVDDVYTTGATVKACARALKQAGAARVLALTIARVVSEEGEA